MSLPRKFKIVYSIYCLACMYICNILGNVIIYLHNLDLNVLKPSNISFIFKNIVSNIFLSIILIIVQQKILLQ